MRSYATFYMHVEIDMEQEANARCAPHLHVSKRSHGAYRRHRLMPMRAISSARASASLPYARLYSRTHRQRAAAELAELARAHEPTAAGGAMR